MLLSTVPLSSLATAEARFGRVHVSRVKRPGPLQAQLGPASYAETSSGELRISPRDLRDGRFTAVARTTHAPEHLRFELEERAEETVLFVSQEYHPQWVARSGAERLETMRINGLYQGVRVPAGTSEVALRFEPWVRWAHLPQIAFALAGAAALAAGARRAVPRRIRA